MAMTLVLLVMDLALIAMTMALMVMTLALIIMALFTMMAQDSALPTALPTRQQKTRRAELSKVHYVTYV